VKSQWTRAASCVQVNIQKCLPDEKSEIQREQQNNALPNSTN
jgi:hypothetical protein